MSHYISLPDLYTAGSEDSSELRSARQYKLYHQSSARPGLAALSVPDLLVLEDQHQNWVLTPRRHQTLNPSHKQRTGIFRKGKKASTQSRDFVNKYEKRKSIKGFFKKSKVNPSSPQSNLSAMNRLSKSETSLLRLHR